MDQQEGPCHSISELLSRSTQFLSIPGNLDVAANYIFDDLIENLVLGITFEIHRETKMGGIPFMSEEEMNKLKIGDCIETDIFAQPPSKKAQECCCLSCNQFIAATRFAPHLAKCLGYGRNSSRIASQRIANNCKENPYGGMSDNDDDEEFGPEKPKLNKKLDGKKKKDKNGVGKNKAQNVVGEKNYGSKTTEGLD